MFIKAMKKKFIFAKDLLDFSNILLLKPYYTLFLVITMAPSILKVGWLQAQSLIKVIVKYFL